MTVYRRRPLADVIIIKTFLLLFLLSVSDIFDSANAVQPASSSPPLKFSPKLPPPAKSPPSKAPPQTKAPPLKSPPKMKAPPPRPPPCIPNSSYKSGDLLLAAQSGNLTQVKSLLLAACGGNIGEKNEVSTMQAYCTSILIRDWDCWRCHHQIGLCSLGMPRTRPTLASIHRFCTYHKCVILWVVGGDPPTLPWVTAPHL